MSSAIIGLTAGFIFVVVLLLTLNLRSTLHWNIKASASIIALVFYIVTLKTLPGFYGWPATEALPQEFQLISSIVEEPRRKTDTGTIYMWIIPADSTDKQPRAYQLDYHTELHSRLNDAQKRMQAGQNVAGAMQDENNDHKRGAIPRFYQVEKKRPPAKPSE